MKYRKYPIFYAYLVKRYPNKRTALISNIFIRVITKAMIGNTFVSEGLVNETMAIMMDKRVPANIVYVIGVTVLGPNRSKTGTSKNIKIVLNKLKVKNV